MINWEILGLWLSVPIPLPQTNASYSLRPFVKTSDPFCSKELWLPRILALSFDEPRT